MEGLEVELETLILPGRVFGIIKVATPGFSKCMQQHLLGLLQNSFTPLTDQYPADEINLIERQAATFFSAFDPDAQWYIKINNLPPHIGNTINGLTPKSKETGIGSRFMRFRFPHVFFEISSIIPIVASEKIPGHVSSTAVWKAWAQGGAISGMFDQYL
ncbi:hypothetical protein BDQ17DRAFT_982590 [Cyathus striatus]|nr:hypothetical protein BDQ17DRAFT_982590 [Cyathus striatus]